MNSWRKRRRKLWRSEPFGNCLHDRHFQRSFESGGFFKPPAICFDVEDTGIGIAPDKQKLIFESFRQADGSTSRKHGGAGLGLAITARLARMLGGQVRLQSVPGQGSIFSLIIPVSPPLDSQLPQMEKTLVG